MILYPNWVKGIFQRNVSKDLQLKKFSFNINLIVCRNYLILTLVCIVIIFSLLSTGYVYAIAYFVWKRSGVDPLINKLSAMTWFCSQQKLMKELKFDLALFQKLVRWRLVWPIRSFRVKERLRGIQLLVIVKNAWLYEETRGDILLKYSVITAH